MVSSFKLVCGDFFLRVSLEKDIQFFLSFSFLNSFLSGTFVHRIKSWCFRFIYSPEEIEEIKRKQGVNAFRIDISNQSSLESYGQEFLNKFAVIENIPTFREKPLEINLSHFYGPRYVAHLNSSNTFPQLYDI